MSKYKKIIISILILLLGVPLISFGSSFVASLIQGKTPAEAVQIIAEQLDKLFGRILVVETQQTETNLEIEKLKLENENLRLKNENLSSESERVSKQVTDNEKSVDVVNRCIVLEKPRICAQNSIQSAQKQLSVSDLSPSASLDEVIAVISGGPWYSKVLTDEICYSTISFQDSVSGRRTTITATSGSVNTGTEVRKETCRSRESQILGFNEDQKRMRRDAEGYLKQATETIQSSQAEFDELQCEVLLKKYVPNRKVPGCA